MNGVKFQFQSILLRFRCTHDIPLRMSAYRRLPLSLKFKRSSTLLRSGVCVCDWHVTRTTTLSATAMATTTNISCIISHCFCFRSPDRRQYSSFLLRWRRVIICFGRLSTTITCWTITLSRKLRPPVCPRTIQFRARISCPLIPAIHFHSAVLRFAKFFGSTRQVKWSWRDDDDDDRRRVLHITVYGNFIRLCTLTWLIISMQLWRIK